MTATATVTPLATYRNETPYPFCPGCGHGSILDALNQALVDLAIDPRKVVLVSDIGCSGLSDQYFTTNAFHGLHGRSLTYASGIKLARPELTVVVILGDGGTGIGGRNDRRAAPARRRLSAGGGGSHGELQRGPAAGAGDAAGETRPADRGRSDRVGGAGRLGGG